MTGIKFAPCKPFILQGLEKRFYFLRTLVWSILGIVVALLVWQFFTKSYGEASGYFCGTLILLGTGLELVRAELAELRRMIKAKDE